MNYYRWYPSDEPAAETIEGRALQTASPGARLLVEHVKRAIFRVPNGHILYNFGRFEPHLEIDFDVAFTQLNNERTLFEVNLRTRIGARKLSVPLTDTSGIGVIPIDVFETDVTISGIFEIVRITGSEIDRWLQHECPSMLFPRARKVIATLTRNMGGEAILIEQSQFVRIRERKMRKAQPNVAGSGNA